MIIVMRNGASNEDLADQLSIELLKPRAGSIGAPVVFSFRESKR